MRPVRAAEKNPVSKADKHEAERFVLQVKMFETPKASVKPHMYTHTIYTHTLIKFLITYRTVYVKIREQKNNVDSNIFEES